MTSVIGSVFHDRTISFSHFGSAVPLRYPSESHSSTSETGQDAPCAPSAAALTSLLAGDGDRRWNKQF